MMKIGLFLSLSHALSLRSTNEKVVEEKVVETQLMEEQIILEKVGNRSKECTDSDKTVDGKSCKVWNQDCRAGKVQKEHKFFDKITNECCHCKTQLEIHRELNGTDESIKAAFEELSREPERKDKSCQFKEENLKKKFMENLDWSAAQGRTLQHGQTIPFHHFCKMGFSSKWYLLLTCKNGEFRVQNTTSTRLSQVMYGWRSTTWTSVCKEVDLSKDHGIETATLLDYKNKLHSIDSNSSNDYKKAALTYVLKAVLSIYGIMKTHMYQFNNQTEIRLKYAIWVDNLVEECVEFETYVIRLKEGNPDCGHEMESDVVLELPFRLKDTHTIDSKKPQEQEAMDKEAMDKLFDRFAASQKGGQDLGEESAQGRKIMASFMDKTMNYMYEIDTVAAQEKTEKEQKEYTKRIQKEMKEHMRESKEEYAKKEIHLCIGTKGRGSLRFILMPLACSDDENFLGFEIMSIVKSNEGENGKYEIKNHLYAPFHENSDRQIKANHYTNKIYDIYDQAAKHFIESQDVVKKTKEQLDHWHEQQKTPNRRKLEHNELDHIEDLLKFPISVASMTRDRLISTKDLWMRMKKKDGKDGKWEDKIRLLFKADEGILDVMHDRNIFDRFLGGITRAGQKLMADQPGLAEEVNTSHMDSKRKVWRLINDFQKCKKCEATWEFIEKEEDHRYTIMYTFNKRKKYFGELFLNKKANEAVGYIKLCGLMKSAIEYLENKQEIIEQRFDTWVTRFKKVASVVMSIVTTIMTAGAASPNLVKDIFSIISAVGGAFKEVSTTIGDWKLFSPIMDVISYASLGPNLADHKWRF